MTGLTEGEKAGSKELLQLLPPEELCSLASNLSNKRVTVETPDDAISIILALTKTAEELLKRKKIHRELLVAYLAKHEIHTAPKDDKQQLIWKVLGRWRELAKTLKNKKDKSLKPTTLQLGILASSPSQVLHKPAEASNVSTATHA
nr:PREDICTED: uncharacterized protein C3orf38 homolog [Latimeria chalumnae]|eukprot:XP_014349619.1 PREDICTED: uncharacterized protein C3orf38 homolog [Latimeria chalumnae]